jgi:hypothetical protein
MKKRLKIPVRSLGAEEAQPTVEDLAAWIPAKRGSICDTITYQLEHSLKQQDTVDIACVGGFYYASRMLDSIEGIEENSLTAEPALSADDVIRDARSIITLRKQTWVCMPGVSELGIKNRYFRDDEEFFEVICSLYLRLMREMRDCGMAGHVVIGNRFSGEEYELLAGPKTFFFSPEPDRAILSAILEVQTSIAIPPALLKLLPDFLDAYDLRHLILMDAREPDFASAAREFDHEELTSGGYCVTDCDDYWNQIVEKAHIRI